MKLLAGILIACIPAVLATQLPLTPNRKHQLPIAVEPPLSAMSSPEYPPAPGIKINPAGNKPASPPPSSSSSSPYEPKIQAQISLSDAMGPIRSISSFSSFSRLCASTSSLLSSSDSNTTVLAPLNSAIDNLPRKPWETSRDYQALGSQAYDGSGGHDRADRNIARFVEAHLVGESPWARGHKVKSLAGRELWWEESGNGERVIMPDGVPVERVASSVSNGELWIIKDVVNYE